MTVRAFFFLKVEVCYIGRMRKTISGFTIVELLIVIVVIAILAAIGIVAYTGIQDRAEASKTASAVQAYKQALTLYKADKGQYPTTGTMCLGDQYGTFTGQSTPSCRRSNSSIDASYNSAARDLLKPYLGGSLPMPSTKFVLSGTVEYSGANFFGSTYNYTLDGRPVVMIYYSVKSDTCPVGPVYLAAGEPNYSSPAVSRTSALTNGSVCFLLLPND